MVFFTFQKLFWLGNIVDAINVLVILLLLKCYYILLIRKNYVTDIAGQKQKQKNNCECSIPLFPPLGGKYMCEFCYLEGLFIYLHPDEPGSRNSIKHFLSHF